MKTNRNADLTTSLLLVVPLFVFYELGVIFTKTLNGADLVTVALLRLLGQRVFVAAHCALLAAVLAVGAYLVFKRRIALRSLLSILAESTLYAVSMGTVIVLVMTRLLGVDPRLVQQRPVHPQGLGERLIVAAGAGVHEELVFRLGLLNALAFFGRRVLRWPSLPAFLIALLLSGALFAGAHHVGKFGEPWRLGTFVYRSLAGVCFGLLYRFRGLHTAIYTHALYDAYVMLVV